MKRIIFNVFFSILFAKGLVAEINMTSIFDNVKNLLDFPDLMDTVTCTDPKFTDFQLYLYTRKSNDSILVGVNNLEVLDPRKKTIVITHGWMYSAFQMEMVALKDAYLKRYDCNVIMVHWADLALDFYSTSVCKLPKIGRWVGEYLCQANAKIGLNLANVHLVGHSLGGQMSGFMGQATIEICNKTIDRITGLDPAGPLYVDEPRPNRLDSTDATFVDIIHTNGGVFGYYGYCGTVDFFINCGTTQPKCRLGDITKDNLSQLPQEIVLCEHARALHIWAEATLTDNFKASSCYYCPLMCPAWFGSNSYVMMGQEGPRNITGGYYVKTNYAKPYAI